MREGEWRSHWVKLKRKRQRFWLKGDIMWDVRRREKTMKVKLQQRAVNKRRCCEWESELVRVKVLGEWTDVWEWSVNERCVREKEMERVRMKQSTVNKRNVRERGGKVKWRAFDDESETELRSGGGIKEIWKRVERGKLNWGARDGD